jgi:diacylglycerol kinase family enzyme
MATAQRPRTSGRVAAGIALAALAVAALALVALAVRHPLTVLIAIGAVFAGGAAFWIAVTRHGALRAAAASAALVGAVAAIAVAVAVFDAGVELAVFAGAVIVAIAATRAALRQTHPAPGPGTHARTRTPAGGRGVLLLNPRSGGGRVERLGLADEARRRGIEALVLTPGDDLEQLARAAAASAAVIGMAGGDGSQALVAGIAMEHELPFVCVPAGTRNHFARDLGIDPDDAVGALDAFAAGTERRVDLGIVNGRVFVNNVSLGVYAEVVQTAGYREAKLRTARERLPELLGPGAPSFDLRFRAPGSDEEHSAQLLLVSNNRYVVDRLTAMGSRPRLDGHELGIVAIRIDDATKAAELISLEVVGQARRFAGWLEWSTPQFAVSSSGPVAAGIDGEALLLDPPVSFRVAPAALRVRLPPSAGVSRAAVTPRLTRRTLRELARIAVHG